MDELWRTATERTAAFDAAAAAYDRYRPRYPESLFDEIVRVAGLTPGAPTVEIGAGTGIATEPLVERALDVVAIEPAPAMAALARDKVGRRARVETARFESVDLGAPPFDRWTRPPAVELVAAFNAWHWVAPRVGLEQLSQLLAPGGWVAVVWTEVVSWGDAPFEALLADLDGAPWPKTVDAVRRAVDPLRADDRFRPLPVSRHRFSRSLDADTFVAVTRTYGGDHRHDRDRALVRIVDDHLGGTVTKVEDAVLCMAQWGERPQAAAPRR